MEEFEAPKTKSSGSGNTAVMIVAIIGIILGATGLCTGGWGLLAGIGSLAAQGVLTEVTTAGMPAETAQAYREFTDASQTAQMLGIPLSGINLLVSILLMVGGILGLTNKQQKLGLLKVGLAACLVSDVLKGIVGLVNWLMLRAPMAKYMEAITSMPGADEVPMQAIMSASMGIGLLISYVWIAICLAYYGWGLSVVGNATKQQFYDA